MTSRVRSHGFFTAATAYCGLIAGLAFPACAQEVSSGSGGGETEIIVTAQRRDERLVDVPIAVATFDEDSLSSMQITAIDDLNRVTPSLMFNRNGSNIQPTIRGIGTSGLGAGAEANVAIYLDGVYLPSMLGNFFDLPNVEQVQVLKGPQGTLFGRNATGGAILITTRNPSFEPAGGVKLGFGSFNEIRASGYGNVPLSDKAAILIAGYSRHSDGFRTDLLTGAKRDVSFNYDVRTKVRLQPSDKVDIILGASYTTVSDPGGLNQTTLNGNSAGNNVPNPPPIATDRRHVSLTYPVSVTTNNKQFDLHVNVDLGFATLSTISALRYEKAVTDADIDSSYTPSQSTVSPNYFDTHSEEITLSSSSGGNLDWTAGLYYFDGDAGNDDFVLNDVVLFSARIGTRAYAAYIDGTYHFGPLSLIAGLRYSDEKKSFRRIVSGATVLQADQKFSAFTPRLGVQYALGPRTNVYGTWTRGFKSGTYNASSASTLAVRPEFVDAFEVGFKTASRTFSLSTSAFYYNYKDIQVNALLPGTSQSALYNAARSEIYGFDIDLMVRPTSNLFLAPRVAYTHGDYTEFKGAPIFTPRTGPTGILIGNSAGFVDASDSQMVRAPRWTASADIGLNVPLPRGELDFIVRPFWTSSVRYSFDGRITQPSYATVDATITWKSSDNLSVSLWGKNITDTTYSSFRSSTSARDGILWAAPASFGGTVSYRFGR